MNLTVGGISEGPFQDELQAESLRGQNQSERFLRFQLREKRVRRSSGPEKRELRFLGSPFAGKLGEGTGLGFRLPFQTLHIARGSLGLGKSFP